MSAYELPPRPIAQRTTYSQGYMNWLWHERHPVELCRDESRRSEWKVINVGSDRPRIRPIGGGATASPKNTGGISDNDVL